MADVALHMQDVYGRRLKGHATECVRSSGQDADTALMLIRLRFEVAVEPTDEQDRVLFRGLRRAAYEAWAATVLTNGSLSLSWIYITGWAAQAAMAFGMNCEETDYAARAGLLPPYDDNNDPVTLVTHRETTLAPLETWMRCGPGWMLCHRAGLPLPEATQMLSRQRTPSDQQALLGLAALRGA